jgi:hypothetical protein
VDCVTKKALDFAIDRYGSIISGVQEVAKSWRTISEDFIKFGIPTSECYLIWKRILWQYSPDMTEFKDGCYCVLPCEVNGLSACPCESEHQQSSQNSNAVNQFSEKYKSQGIDKHWKQKLEVSFSLGTLKANI